MKKSFSFLLLTFIVSALHAQYAPFFTDQFDSNTNHWFAGEIKKSTVEFNHSDYSFYNEEGKKTIISLIDIPFDEKKNYRVTSNVIKKYIPSHADGMYGVMFAAKDEKNGYAVLLDQFGVCHVVKIENRKIKELSKTSTLGENRGGGEISITLEDWRWQFKLGGKVMYSCKPLPWMGHKAGFYCSAEASFSASSLVIEEAIPSNPCPLPFTRENFNEQFGKIICSAAQNFTNIKGDKIHAIITDTIWTKPTIKIDGAAVSDVMRLSKSPRQYLVTFVCRDSMNLDYAERMFDGIADIISNSHPSCYQLKQQPVKYNFSKEIPKDVQWLDESGPWLMVELVLHHVDYYEVVIHVYAEK